ncbi:MAG: efflux transporter periplasmic adaptor subunit [Kangiella sp.]|nr:MAG: efflux transporter periplasmic adaptor subunit [Kangiella sp.]
MSSNDSTKSIDQASKFKKVLIPVGIILAGLVVLILMTMSAPKPHKKEIIKKATLVDVVEVSRGNVIFEINSQGSVSPRTETTLVSEVSGQIKQVSNKFVVGGFFKKGEILITIDPISYEVGLLQAQARFDGANARLVEEKARGKQAEKEWKLTGRSFKNAPILALRKPQLQQALADVKAAQADVKSAEIKLARTKIKSPYDAMVKAKMVDIGQYVSTGSQLAITFAVDYAEIRLPIKEQDIAFIDVPPLGSLNNKGSNVLLSTFQGGKLKTWSTFITRSEGVVDASSRVNYVVAQLNDPYGLLQVKEGDDSSLKAEPIQMGTFVKAKIFGIESENIVTIPRKAIRGANEIYLIGDDKKLNITKIDILRSDANNVYISSGVDDGTQVIITKLATAVNGMAVRLPGDPIKNLLEEKAPKVEDADGTDSESSESMLAGKSAPVTPKVEEKAPLKDGGNL